MWQKERLLGHRARGAAGRVPERRLDRLRRRLRRAGLARPRGGAARPQAPRPALCQRPLSAARRRPPATSASAVPELSRRSIGHAAIEGQTRTRAPGSIPGVRTLAWGSCQRLRLGGPPRARRHPRLLRRLHHRRRRHRDGRRCLWFARARHVPAVHDRRPGRPLPPMGAVASAGGRAAVSGRSMATSTTSGMATSSTAGGGSGTRSSPASILTRRWTSSPRRASMAVGIDKPAMHAHVASYFASRREDG